jgi:hypothetical protein
MGMMAGPNLLATEEREDVLGRTGPLASGLLHSLLGCAMRIRPGQTQHRAENGGAWGASLDFQRCAAQKRKGWGGRKVKFFCIFKTVQTIEFNYKFESTQPKTMHQHECNNKLL